MLERPRLRLEGKRATRDELVSEIVSLLNGTSVRRPYPLSITEVARIFSVSRQTIYTYLKVAKENKQVTTWQNGRLFLPRSDQKSFRKFNKYHPITKDPLVSEWMDDLVTRRGGNPISTWRTRIRDFESVCNTCRVNPSDFLVSNRNTEKILRQYAQHYRQGKEDRIIPRKKKVFDISAVIYHKAQALRDFCGFYGMIWKRGTKGVMSQRVTNHGLYADIRFSDQEFEDADRFIKERWGLDSDIFRWFWIGIESCARFGALYDMNLEYTKHINPSNGKITYIMTAFESKTKDVRGGKWYKYVTRPDTQKSIDLLKERGGTRIHESTGSIQDFQKEISLLLAEIYRHLGKTTPYFFNHPTHVLRHIGAHYWLSKKDYNYGLVSEIGGWNTMDELKKSYGLIPPEKILEIIEDQ